MSSAFSLSGRIVDAVTARIFSGIISIENGRIKSVEESSAGDNGPMIMPGFIDAHVHVESSMLIPTEFGRLASIHGTVATISDPHEIGNVLGIDGVKFMIENGRDAVIKLYFGAPSCVPATAFETAGAEIGVAEIEELMAMDEVRYLAEMMNFPGVLNADEMVMQKIAIAHKYGKVVDGHAPGLTGEDVIRYISAGISTDHECFTIEEALGKLKHGMKILIREGSAAKNFEALIPLLHDHPDMIMFCSDDKHPNDLVVGHIDQLARRAVAHGHDPMNVIRATSHNVVEHYGLEVGLLQPGDHADLILVDNLTEFNVKATYVNGGKVAEAGRSLHEARSSVHLNNFNHREVTVEDIRLEAPHGRVKVIEVEDGQLITNSGSADLVLKNGKVESDPENDILKLVVVNRYSYAPVASAFVKNFGFSKGAIASSVAHDSHNIIAVGVSDEDIVAAVNLVLDERGGVSVASGDRKEVLPLPVAGLMSSGNGFEVAARYEELDALAKELGAKLDSPFMTLSFCALLVIPNLKLSDKGLFNGETFEFTSLFED